MPKPNFRIFGTMSCGQPPCLLETIVTYVWFVFLAMAMVSSKISSRPPLPSIRLKTWELSLKLTLSGTFTPSRSDSSNSALKTTLLKCACKCSLDKLISNCSREFCSKASKPAMSNTPSNFSLLASSSRVKVRVLFMQPMSQVNRRPYQSRARASRAAAAWSTVRLASVVSPPMTNFFLNKQASRSEGGTPRSSAAFSTGARSTTREESASSPSWSSMFPSVKMPAVILNNANLLSSSNCKACKLSHKSSKFLTSSIFPATVWHPWRYL
mmetsp:Transcript_25069/g.66606  ORF Transcript_25069/g.66606 Transcript_25069/m.66606 type:complete len:269 (+) Transcript_25069:532-1338(+)